MCSPGVEKDPGRIKFHDLTCQESISNILCGWNPNKNQLWQSFFTVDIFLLTFAMVLQVILVDREQWLNCHWRYWSLSVFRNVRQSTNLKHIHYQEGGEAVNCTTAFYRTSKWEGKSINQGLPSGLWKAWRYANSNLTRRTSRGARGLSRCPQSSQQGSIRTPPGFLHQSGSVSTFGEERPNGRKCTTSSPPPRAAIMEHPWSLMERTSHLKSFYSVSVIIHGHHFLRI